jgi:hypothetical protein
MGSDEGLGGSASLEMGALSNGQHATQRTWPLAAAKAGAAGLDAAVAARGPQSDHGCSTPRCEPTNAVTLNHALHLTSRWRSPYVVTKT